MARYRPAAVLFALLFGSCGTPTAPAPVATSIILSEASLSFASLGETAQLSAARSVGTLLFAFLMGPSMQAAFKLFRVSKDPSPSFAVEGCS